MVSEVLNETWKGPMTSEGERGGGGGAAGCSHLHRFGRVRDDGHDHLCLRRGLDLNFFFLQRAEAHIAYTGDGYVNTLQVIFVWEKHSVTSCG